MGRIDLTGSVRDPESQERPVKFRVLTMTPQLTEEVEEKEFEGSDGYRNLLSDFFEMAKATGSKPRRIRLGKLVLENLLKELATNWPGFDEFKENIIGLNNGTTMVCFDPDLGEFDILID